MQELHHQARLAATAGRGTVGIAAAGLTQALEAGFAAEGGNFIFVVAYHFQWRTLCGQHIHHAGDLALQRFTVFRAMDAVVVAVIFTAVDTRLQGR